MGTVNRANIRRYNGHLTVRSTEDATRGESRSVHETLGKAQQALMGIAAATRFAGCTALMSSDRVSLYVTTSTGTKFTYVIWCV